MSSPASFVQPPPYGEPMFIGDQLNPIWFMWFYQNFRAASATADLQILEAVDTGDAGTIAPQLEDSASRKALVAENTPGPTFANLEDFFRTTLFNEPSNTLQAMIDDAVRRAMSDDVGLSSIKGDIDQLARLIAMINDNAPAKDLATVFSLNGLTGAVVLQDGIGEQIDLSGQDINLSFAPHFAQKNADYSVTDADMGIAFILSAAHTCTLQHGGSVVPNRLLWIANYYNSTAVLTIAPHAGDVIGGLSSYPLEPGQGLLLQWDGGNQWVVVALRGDPPPLVLTFTAAQIKAMHATPLQLVAAAGSGTIIEIVSVILNYAFVSASYAAGGAIKVYYGGGTDVIGTTPAAFLVGPTSNQTVQIPVVIPEGNSTDMLNQNVYLWNDTAPFTTGDSQVTAVVRYRAVRGLS